MRWSVAARQLHRAVNQRRSVLTVQKAPGTRRATIKASGKHSRPHYSAESHCAAVRCSHPINSWAENPTPPKSGSSSSSALARCLTLLTRDGIGLRNAEGHEFIIWPHEEASVWLFVPNDQCCWERVAEISAAAATANFIFNRVVLTEAPTSHAPLFDSNYQTPRDVLWLLLVSMNIDAT